MKILDPNRNIPIPVMSKVLWVVKPTYFHPKWEVWLTGSRVGSFDFYQLPFARKVLVSGSVAAHQKANPRSIEYMLEAGLDFFKKNAPDAQIDILPDKNAEVGVPGGQAAKFHHIWGGQSEDLRPLAPAILKKLHNEGYDTIVFLYADAIGRGWMPIENRMRNLGANQTLVLNGRKRVFVFDREAHRMLLWRRFLERTWLVELVMAPLLLLLSLPLAIYDLTLGKLIRSKSSHG